MISIVPLNKINNTTEVINKSSIICNSHALNKKVPKMGTFLYLLSYNLFVVHRQLTLKNFVQRQLERFRVSNPLYYRQFFKDNV